MIRALALLLLAAPAHAAGNAPGTHLWPEEPAYEATVIEVTCTDLKDCCGIHRECGGGPYHPAHLTRPDPAPVPLPFSGLMLTAALGLLWRMRKWSK